MSRLRRNLVPNLPSRRPRPLRQRRVAPVGPGMPPPNTPPVRGRRPGVPGVRRPGSGGSRTMRRPTMGNVMRGPTKRRGY